MKPSLEEERRALIAQIEASRAVYRRMLSGTSAEAGSHSSQKLQPEAMKESYTNFPRSRTVQWMMDHPLVVATGVAALVWAAPRWWESRRRIHSARAYDNHHHQHRSPRYDERRQVRQDVLTEGTGRALLTVAALLMRNPATMRALSRIANTAWQWLQQRRSRQTSKRLDIY